MSHPDPSAAPDLRPIAPGEVFENPFTRERATIIELPWPSVAGKDAGRGEGLPKRFVAAGALERRARLTTAGRALRRVAIVAAR